MSEEKYKETIESYNKNLPEFLKKLNYFDSKQKEHLDYTMKLLPSYPKKKVVFDIGCGTGKDLNYLKENYDIVDIGLDRSDVMVRISKGIKGDMRYLPIKDDSCDVVISNSSLVHLNKKDKEMVLKEVYRVLKGEGIFSVWVQNLYSFPYIKYFKDFLVTSISNRKIEKGYAYANKRHWYYPTKKEMLDLFNKTNFEIIYSNSMFSRWLEFFVRPIK